MLGAGHIQNRQLVAFNTGRQCGKSMIGYYAIKGFMEDPFMTYLVKNPDDIELPNTVFKKLDAIEIPYNTYKRFQPEITKYYKGLIEADYRAKLLAEYLKESHNDKFI